MTHSELQRIVQRLEREIQELEDSGGYATALLLQRKEELRVLKVIHQYGLLAERRQPRASMLDWA